MIIALNDYGCSPEIRVQYDIQSRQRLSRNRRTAIHDDISCHESYTVRDNDSKQGLAGKEAPWTCKHSLSVLRQQILEEPNFDEIGQHEEAVE